MKSFFEVASIAAMTEEFVHNTARDPDCERDCLTVSAWKVRHLTGHDPTMAKRRPKSFEASNGWKVRLEEHLHRLQRHLMPEEFEQKLSKDQRETEISTEFRRNVDEMILLEVVSPS